MPIDFSYEALFGKKHGYKIIAGVDEVGRGPLAGPVTAGAFVFLSGSDPDGFLGFDPALRILRDSKLLSAKQRGELFLFFCELKKEGKADFATASVFPKTIDKKHIHHAVVLAMRRAVSKLSIEPNHALIDKFSYSRKFLHTISYTLVPRGDDIVPSIAAASIVAKVKRDKTMLRYHSEYPCYRFDLHKGYGTKFHRDMICKRGLSPIHRKSFRLHNIT
ncbi:MAG: hypothetical protein A2932_01180 [Candidatus Spechtbacteria bacterium RIFCSPLOWO2_01_FULL_46_10]|uniref:Ribonuclease n=1 Tax=Candidatus Spechtbacteria bacterium RIFCSPLOWO2_01_FULL_46_10 TaxID=1802163 RepID=A0A1G2HEM9_9BACT|nr:MAG: hypothetical protein A2932_01180 [Candidatus Spechtbacteria bacterium RIFCSPLOWO2_01_FULL_46_10]